MFVDNRNMPYFSASYPAPPFPPLSAWNICFVRIVKNTSFPLVKQKVFVKQTSGRFMSQENTFKFNSFLFFLVFTFLFICQLRSQFSPLFPHTQRTTRMTGGLFCVKRLEMFVMFIFILTGNISRGSDFKIYSTNKLV